MEILLRRQMLIKQDFYKLFIIISLYLMSTFTAAVVTEKHGFSVKYLDRNFKNIKLECDGSVSTASEGVTTSIVIYNNVSMLALVEMTVGECPTVRESPLDINIYTLACVSGRDTLLVLKVIITDLEISTSRTFGCNVTRLRKSGETTQTTWTIVVGKLGHRAGERAAESPSNSGSARTLPEESRPMSGESRTLPGHKYGTLVDSYLPIYVMGMAILSLAIGLAAALCYIGMSALKARRSSNDAPAVRRSSRQDEETDPSNETASESDNGTDAGCERTLMCPAVAGRRPSHQNQDYSEPLSPAPSGFSDYIGFDFMQTQLSNKCETISEIRFPRNNTARHELASQSPGQRKLIETQIGKQVLDKNMENNCKDKSIFSRFENTFVFLEKCAFLETDFSGDSCVSRYKFFINLNKNMNKNTTPQRARELLGNY